MIEMIEEMIYEVRIAAIYIIYTGQPEARFFDLRTRTNRYCCRFISAVVAMSALRVLETPWKTVAAVHVLSTLMQTG